MTDPDYRQQQENEARLAQAIDVLSRVLNNTATFADAEFLIAEMGLRKYFTINTNTQEHKHAHQRT